VALAARHDMRATAAHSQECGEQDVQLIAPIYGKSRESPPGLRGGDERPNPLFVPMLDQAFPYEKPQVERSEAPDVYAGVFHTSRVVDLEEALTSLAVTSRPRSLDR